MKDYSALAKELQRVFPGMDLREMEPMDRHTTFRVGGRVSLFCRPGDEEETVSLCARLRSAGVRPFIMGRGSNLLFADGILHHNPRQDAVCKQQIAAPTHDKRPHSGTAQPGA